MKKILLILAIPLFALSCEKEPNPNNPDNPVPDPKGTIILDIRKDGQSGENDFAGIGINGADNFYNSYASGVSWQFCNLGEMKGLGNITTIPTTGYASEVGVRPGCGYVGKRVYTADAVEYIAFYVDSYIEAAGYGGVIGTTVRYLHPYKPNTYGGGDGTAQSPYIINTEAQLRSMHPSYLGQIYFKLGNDIELTKDWIPLPVGYHYSSLLFDGDGHTISNLSINLPDRDFVGLFSQIYSVKNLNLVLASNGIIGRNHVGGIAGLAFSVTNCSVTGNITGSGQDIGGIIGYLSYNGGNISLCSVNGNITGNINIGGIAGQNYSGSTIINCYVIGNIEGYNSIGGISGENNSGSIVNNFFVGKLTSDYNLGGVIGYNNGNITSCYFDKTLAETDIAVGNTTDTTGALTTEQMKQKASFVGWDFETIWDIDEGVSYPFLR